MNVINTSYIGCPQRKRLFINLGTFIVICDTFDKFDDVENSISTDLFVG